MSHSGPSVHGLQIVLHRSGSRQISIEPPTLAVDDAVHEVGAGGGRAQVAAELHREEVRAAGHEQAPHLLGAPRADARAEGAAVNLAGAEVAPVVRHQLRGAAARAERVHEQLADERALGGRALDGGVLGAEAAGAGEARARARRAGAVDAARAGATASCVR